MDCVLSLSYGKDSVACLGALEKLGWPLDRIIHAEIMATNTIPADLPPMVEFKAKADTIIKERWGIEVEHVSAGVSYDDVFYKVRTQSRMGHNGKIYGFPCLLHPWCVSELKVSALKKAQAGASCIYIGIAKDEPKRLGRLNSKEKSPLEALGWTEKDCRRWCEENNLLSPIYTTSERGGCWFCHNQGVDQLRNMRKNYPKYWSIMLKWDGDSPITFQKNGHTIHDFERRFQLEDEGFLHPEDRNFRWDMLDQELNFRLF